MVSTISCTMPFSQIVEITKTLFLKIIIIIIIPTVFTEEEMKFGIYSGFIFVLRIRTAMISLSFKIWIIYIHLFLTRH